MWRMEGGREGGREAGRQVGRAGDGGGREGEKMMNAHTVTHKRHTVQHRIAVNTPCNTV